jgi:hypothetical protein
VMWRLEPGAACNRARPRRAAGSRRSPGRRPQALRRSGRSAGQEALTVASAAGPRRTRPRSTAVAPATTI